VWLVGLQEVVAIITELMESGMSFDLGGSSCST